MPTFYSTKNTLEELPDELLLLICRYLSPIDTLFSFYGLNYRLSRMISGYFRHIVMGQLPYKQFLYTCTSILPDIGSNITSLVVSNQWKGVLSKLFINYFGNRMSLIFPHLEQISLISFSDKSLTSFLDCLENLFELHEIVLCHLYEVIGSTSESENLLHKIFTANNNRLNSILFDDDSMIFSFTDKDHDIIYSNIQQVLSIDLKTINDLHRLLTLLPQLRSISVNINKDTIESNKINQNKPIVTLKQFQLQSFGPSWTLDDLRSILKRIPNVEELSIAIEVSDGINLINGEDVYPLISILPLRKFNYFLRFYDSSSSIDHVKILSSWQQFKQEFICIKSENKKMLVLYTLPFVFSFVILASSIAKQEVFIEHYAPQVKIFTLCGNATDTMDMFSIIKKCHRLQNLNLRFIGNNNLICSKEIRLCKLTYLTKLTALRESSINLDCFQKLLEISPNLHHLEINYDLLKLLFDNESICILLKYRITCIYILITKTTDIQSVVSSISYLPPIFQSLKHIYFCFEKTSQFYELLIMTVLKYLSKWNCLISFGVVGNELTKTIASKNLQQWILNNSTLQELNSFIVDCTDDAFRLWL